VNLWLLAGAPLLGYGFAWYAHFFVEGNRPATFGHPFWSLAADYRMLWLVLTGRMGAELEKLGINNLWMFIGSIIVRIIMVSEYEVWRSASPVAIFQFSVLDSQFRYHPHPQI
jgi:hypothetical protein